MESETIEEEVVEETHEPEIVELSAGLVGHGGVKM